MSQYYYYEIVVGYKHVWSVHRTNYGYHNYVYVNIYQLSVSFQK